MGESRFSDDTDVSDFTNAVVAQLVERWTKNPSVTGSIPVVGTISHSGRNGHCT